MDLVKVNGTNMVRDKKSMALINTDNNEKNEYYSKVRLLQNQKEQINTVKSEINDIRNEMKEIKELMLKLIEKGSNG
jgi:hypothetical protein